MSKARRLGVAAGVIVALGLAALASKMCIRAWVFHGISVPYCPAGTPQARFGLHAQQAQRGRLTYVQVRGTAYYTRGPSDQALATGLRRLEATLSITDPSGKTTPLVPVKEHEWQRGQGWASCGVMLPDGPDGDWTLSATIDSPLGPGEAKLKLPLYSPARLHVLTDRPLYQPGQVVLVRALGLRAADLAPLDGRPGAFTLTAPNGEIVVEEKAPLGEWGVASTSIPLDPEAEVGDWQVSWVSGGASESARFRVEPFVLPRFAVEAAPARPAYRPGERPTARGTVRYASGAPVAGASVELRWSLQGAWPPPTDWLSEALPRRATTDPAGRFTLELPAIPRDLSGRATLSASLAVTDDTGDRVESGLAFLLSEDGISVEPVTELVEGGLVEGFNNRVYLRATTPDGGVLAKTRLVVRRSWDALDKGLTAETDEDGVASIQLDPGPAVNVVIPPLPYRPPPRPPAVSWGGWRELVGGEGPSMADQRELERWPPALAPCGRFVSGAENASLALRVAPSGQIVGTSAGTNALERCLASAARGLRLAPGKERLYSGQLVVREPELPTASASLDAAQDAPDGLAELVDEAVRDARSCLDRGQAEPLSLPRLAFWRVDAGARAVKLEWAADPTVSDALPAGIAGCVEAKLAKLTLAEDAQTNALGVLRVSTSPVGAREGHRPQATVMLGYELSVSAFAGNEPIGSTKIRLSPGAVPQLRMRATPVLAKPGDTIEVELIRGPGFSGELPKKLWLGGKGATLEAELDKETRRAVFALPADARGWYEVSWGGARAMAYVLGDDALALDARPDRPRYKPGETARIQLETKLGGRAVAAAVGLFGVDESLGQLAALPGPDALGKLRPKVNTPQPAFGVLDGEALAMGRVRGANAAQAIISRVAGLPAVEPVDVAVDAATNDRFDPVEALTDRFYGVLGQLHRETRAWEASAPASEKMKPKTMAKLFDAALKALEERGEKVSDAYGQRLRLSQLPPDLLALCAPSAVVVNGTRLPEDVEDWAGWVRKERP